MDHRTSEVKPPIHPARQYGDGIASTLGEANHLKHAYCGITRLPFSNAVDTGKELEILQRTQGWKQRDRLRDEAQLVADRRGIESRVDTSDPEFT